MNTPAQADRPAVRYRDVVNVTVDPPRRDASLLDVSLHAGLPHFHQCNATARCTTCRVQVLEGAQNLSERTGAEAQIATERGWPDSIRLACQARVLGDVTVSRLVLEEAAALALYPEPPVLQPAGEKHLAVMFCDLRNFTSFAAAHLPHDVVYVLNRFFREACEPVLENGGFIDKYIGDGFLAVFGLNKSDPKEFCLDASRAAARIPARVRDLNLFLKDTFNVTFDFGVGLHYGPAVVGQTGHPLKMQLTVLGDTVNIASRAESRTKQTESRILATSAFCEQVHPMVIPGRKYRLKLTKSGHWDTLGEITADGIHDPALLVQISYDMIRSDPMGFAQAFYTRLFAQCPHVAPLFARTNMEVLQRMFMEMIGRAVQNIYRLGDMAPVLRDLGRRHVRYGARPEYYPMVGGVLIETMAEKLGDRFLPEMREAWQEAYRQITGMMQGIG
jgi:class 3 adenylate cyclase/hemoglobin-like flavoprotein